MRTTLGRPAFNPKEPLNHLLPHQITLVYLFIILTNIKTYPIHVSAFYSHEKHTVVRVKRDAWHGVNFP